MQGVWGSIDGSVPPMAYSKRHHNWKQLQIHSGFFNWTIKRKVSEGLRKKKQFTWLKQMETNPEKNPTFIFPFFFLKKYYAAFCPVVKESPEKENLGDRHARKHSKHRSWSPRTVGRRKNRRSRTRGLLSFRNFICTTVQVRVWMFLWIKRHIVWKLGRSFSPKTQSFMIENDDSFFWRFQFSLMSFLLEMTCRFTEMVLSNVLNSKCLCRLRAAGF